MAVLQYEKNSFKWLAKVFIWIFPIAVVALITEYITFIEYAIKKVMIAFAFIDSL